jgi:hypothetical protein
VAASRATVEIIAQLRDNVTGPLRGINQAMRTAFAGLRSIFGVGLGVGAFASIKSLAEADAAVLRLAKTSRSSVEDISALRFALDDLGIGSAQLKGLLDQIEGNRADAVRGRGQARTAFGQLGIDLADLERLGAVDLLKQIGDGYLVAGQSAEAAAQLQAIFGDRFRELLPLLGQGSQGFDTLRRRAEAFGAVLSKADAETATRFTRAYLEFTTVATSLFRELSNKLLPSLTATLNTFRRILFPDDSVEGRVVSRLERMADLQSIIEATGTGGFLGVAERQRFSAEEIEAIKKAGGNFERFGDGTIQVFNRDEVLRSLRSGLDTQKPIKVVVEAVAEPQGFLDGFRDEIASTQEELSNMYRTGQQAAREFLDIGVSNITRALRELRQGAIELKDVFQSLLDGLIEDLAELATRELTRRFLTSALGLIGLGGGAGTGDGLNVPGIPDAINSQRVGAGRGLLGSGNKRLAGLGFGGTGPSSAGGATTINLQSNATYEEQRMLVSKIMEHEASRNRQVRVAYGVS